MFEHMLFPVGNTHQTRNAIFAFAGELGVLAIATVTMAYYDVLPMKLPPIVVPLVLSAPPPPPPPPPAPAYRAPAQTAVSKLPPRIFNVPVPVAPSAIPQHAAILADAAPSLPDLSGGVLGGVPGGVPGGIPGGALNGSLGAFVAPPVATAAPKPVATPAAPSAPAQIQVGGEVEAALLTHQVIPLYPALAMNARLEGTVRLSAIIAVDGRVKNLRVISGNPLLVEAAQDAVKKWVYRPTYLNGVPAEVITEINVQFHLLISKG